MFNLNAQQHYYLYRPPTDMRKGFDGLSGLVRHQMGQDPLSGGVFIFINRRRDRMKLLVWEAGGFVLYYKRLERGTFELPQSTADTWNISWSQLVFILQGIRLSSIQKRTRYHLPSSH